MRQHTRVVLAICLGCLWGCCALAMGDANSPPLTSRGNGTILRVSPSATTVPRYGCFELTADISASYDNPYDPAQVDLSGIFTAPSGKTVVVPGFFYQAYRRQGTDPDSPILARVGDPCWKVRFSPTEVGRYRCVLRLRDRFDGEVRQDTSRTLAFRCVPSSSPGFIRVTPGSHYFSFDSGAPFYPVGQNVQNDWVDYRHTEDLVDGGANCARAWVFCHWTWLEWSPLSPVPNWAPPGHYLRQYGGAGVYNQGIAWMADQYIDRCHRDGIRLMLCIGAARAVSAGTGFDQWGGNPYNRANGGFLDKPEEYWSNPRARQLAKNRLRYIAARYGYSTAIWAWEFWNELGGAGPDVTAWHREMGDYLHTVDPNHHLRTVSTWQTDPTKLAPIWRLPEIDFTQSHIYAPSTAFEPTISAYLRLYGKPHVVGEGGGPAASAGGSDTAGRPCTVDPEGIDFHNSLWLPMMVGAAGGTLPWHWRQRIEPEHLSYEYGALARFLRHAPPGRLRVASVAVKLADPARANGHLSPAVIVPVWGAWGRRAASDRFVLRPDGTIQDLDKLSGWLFGAWRKQWRRPPTFVVTYPTGGRFIVHVGDMLNSVLVVSVDGREVLREGNADTPRKTVDRDYGVDVPAGTHEISLDNAGNDCINSQYFVFTRVRDSARYPDLEAHALLAGDAGALVWLRNRLNEWAFRAAGVPLRPTAPAVAIVRGLTAGPYRVQWWDTYRGVPTGETTAKADGAGLRLLVPPVERDVACIVRRIGGK